MALPLLPRDALPRNLEDAVVQLDAEVLGAHAGDVHVDDELVIRFIDIGARLPFGGCDKTERAAVGDFIEINVQLVGEMTRKRAGDAGRTVGSIADVRATLIY